jgi:hypothetical protein
MFVSLALAISTLGIVLNGWSRAGIEAGDHERRLWARYAGVTLGVLGALAAFVAAVLR